MTAIPSTSPEQAAQHLGGPPRGGVSSAWSRLKGFGRTLLAFAGPGYLVAVGYMDPGNRATDLAGGSKYGFALLPVVIISSLTAIFLQWLALRLGIVSGRDLARLCRDRFPLAVARLLWIACETAIVACDLAEVIGAAIALKLLFHMPMLIGVSLTALDSLLILALQGVGMRRLEALVVGLMAVIGACFVYELACCHTPLGSLVASLIPGSSTLTDPSRLYLALGIFGATVMPHNLYLHSALVTGKDAGGDLRRRLQFSALDCVAALAVALVVNAAILVLAADAFNHTGHPGVAELEDAAHLLTPILGTSLAAILFSVALLAAGQNSTLTGTLAGEIVMEGFLNLKLPPEIRRLSTRALAILPALLIIGIFGERAASQLLVMSQVVLSLQLGFAVVPLVMFTGDKTIMGGFANGPLVAFAGVIVAAGVVGVNVWLVIQSV